jgi:TRAP-type C4-dicarboxylate transport system permease small subunit
MKKPAEKGALDLLEEATHLLRLAASRTLLCYYAGALPFVLGALYFWSDMSRGAFAHQRLPQGAVGLALLFAWMKTGQALFARQLLAQLGGEPMPRWHVGPLARLFAGQLALQPWGLFLLPVALVVAVPFPWTYAFFQNLTVLAASEEGGLRALLARAWRQARLWSAQNVSLQLVLFLFGGVVVFNVMAGVALVPFVLDRFLGLPTAFTQSHWALLNSTFLAAVLGLAYLCLDPLVKAVHVLRCFYGESLQSGADLKADLRRFAGASPLALAALVLWAALGLAPGLQAAPELEEPARPLPQMAVAPGAAPLSPAALDQSITRVINRREFLWRWPREKAPPREKEAGILAGLWDWFTEQLGNAAKAIFLWVRDAIVWLRDLLSPRINMRSTPGDWTAPLRALTVLLIAALVGLLLWLAWRLWQQSLRRAVAEVLAQPAAAPPDLADENVGAEQLPEDGWLTLARDLWQRGELRLALRAFYLSSLAHLADRELITLARFKSNLDYERELGGAPTHCPTCWACSGRTSRRLSASGMACTR